jgi:hypothetical protein
MASLLNTILLFFLSTQTEVDIDLSDYKGEKRVLIVVAKNHKEMFYTKQIRSVQTDGLDERDLILVSLTGKTGFVKSKNKHQIINLKSVEKLRKQLQIRQEEFMVILIGKDGREKHRQNTPVTSAELFSMIDAMPMRKAEMRKKH